MTTLASAATALLLVAVIAPMARAEQQAGADAMYRWFSLPVEVEGLPADSESVPVTCAVDLSAALARLDVAGAPDERSLRLIRLGAADAEEEPVQFSPAPQPRPERRAALPDTPGYVSYLGEYPAGETPEGVAVSGEMTWLAHADGGGRARYRLEFGILREGTLVQVPYPPQNLRAFDAAGRATPVRHFPRMQVRPQQPLDGKVDLFDGRDLVTSYHVGPGSSVDQGGGRGGGSAPRRPFLYPLIGPEGLPLTEFGKPHDPTGSHAHHYSLWIAHASVDGHDFWSEQGGSIVHEQLELLEDGPVFCRIAHRARWVAADGGEVLRERRVVTIYRAAERDRVLDVELELAPAGAADVTLDATTFGFLAVRVAQPMSVFDGGGEILNARGDRNERGAHLKPAEWIDLAGPVADGLWNGVAVLDHPDNPNHPTVWHCRNDGWACASFNAKRPHTIRPGEPLRLRYRVLLHRGNAAEGAVASRYAEFAARPAVKLGEPGAIER